MPSWITLLADNGGVVGGPEIVGGSIALAGIGFVLWYARHITTVVLPARDVLLKDMQESYQAAYKALADKHEINVKVLMDELRVIRADNRADLKEFWKAHNDTMKEVTTAIMAANGSIARQTQILSELTNVHRVESETFAKISESGVLAKGRDSGPRNA